MIEIIAHNMPRYINRYEAWRSIDEPKTNIMIHATEGPRTVEMFVNGEKIVNGVVISSQYVIDANFNIHLIPPNDSVLCFHVGDTDFRNISGYRHNRKNSIGIEHENSGLMGSFDNRMYAKSAELIDYIINYEKHPIRYIIPHEFSSRKKLDPGVNWDWNSFENELRNCDLLFSSQSYTLTKKDKLWGTGKTFTWETRIINFYQSLAGSSQLENYLDQKDYQKEVNLKVIGTGICLIIIFIILTLLLKEK